MANFDEIKYLIPITFSHRIVFAERLFSVINPTLIDLLESKKRPFRGKVLCFVDEGLSRAQPRLVEEIQNYFTHYSERVVAESRPHIVVGGEAAKCSKVFDSIVQVIADAGLCRHSYVVVVGGGAVIDSVCYAASVVHRGIRQVRIPTTVLAQNDAGIGIKNGINAQGQKNFLGTFHPPFAVINDFQILHSLNPVEWRNGLSEAVKVALIRDREFFLWIESNARSLFERNLENTRLLIRRCAELHLRHIATGGDPFELGSSRPLDFGHWAAHKLEQLSGFRLGHGYAVALGIAIDVMYSMNIHLLSESEGERILKCLNSLGFDLNHSLLRERKKVLEGLSEFQQHLGGRLTITLLKGIGFPIDVHSVDLAMMEESIQDLTKSNLFTERKFL